MCYRILVVDDFVEWRQKARSILERNPELCVIAEASDGEQAVRQVSELKPDLIVLDVGLPVLNGIEAAVRMLAVSPQSKILFLSQEQDQAIVEVAFSVGASAYVHKLNVNNELLRGVSAVLTGRLFLSSGIDRQCFGSSIVFNPRVFADVITA